MRRKIKVNSAIWQRPTEEWKKRERFGSSRYPTQAPSFFALPLLSRSFLISTDFALFSSLNARSRLVILSLNNKIAVIILRAPITTVRTWARFQKKDKKIGEFNENWSTHLFVSTIKFCWTQRCIFLQRKKSPENTEYSLYSLENTDRKDISWHAHWISEKASKHWIDFALSTSGIQNPMVYFEFCAELKSKRRTVHYWIFVNWRKFILHFFKIKSILHFFVVYVEIRECAFCNPSVLKDQPVEILNSQTGDWAWCRSMSLLDILEK